MVQFFGLQRNYNYRNRMYFPIIFGSVLGYLAGLLPAANSPHIVSLMRRAVYTPVSIVWLFAVLCFPLLLSACAVIYHIRFILPVLAFSKCTVFLFCARCMKAAFGGAGWLIGFLYLYSSIWNLSALYFFWFRHADGEEAGLWRDLIISICLQAITAITDVLLIAPLLMRITF